MKLKKSIVALALGLLMIAGYQVNAQMDGVMEQETMGGHKGCKTMMAKGMGDMDGMRHKMMNTMMGDHMGNADVTPEQQVEIDTIKAKYQDDLQAKEKVIDAKMADLDNAWADESTTVGEINVIQGDLQTLKSAYQQVKIKMNQEIGAKIGTDMMSSGMSGAMRCNGKCDGKLCGTKTCDGKGCAGKVCDGKCGSMAACKCDSCDKKTCDGKLCDGKGCKGHSGGRHMRHGSM